MSEHAGSLECREEIKAQSRESLVCFILSTKYSNSCFTNGNFLYYYHFQEKFICIIILCTPGTIASGSASSVGSGSSLECLQNQNCHSDALVRDLCPYKIFNARMFTWSSCIYKTHLIHFKERSNFISSSFCEHRYVISLKVNITALMYRRRSVDTFNLNCSQCKG